LSSSNNHTFLLPDPEIAEPNAPVPMFAPAVALHAAAFVVELHAPSHLNSCLKLE